MKNKRHLIKYIRLMFTIFIVKIQIRVGKIIILYKGYALTPKKALET